MFSVAFLFLVETIFSVFILWNMCLTHWEVLFLMASSTTHPESSLEISDDGSSDDGIVICCYAIPLGHAAVVGCFFCNIENRSRRRIGCSLYFQ